jgi:hypothetical protein
MASALGVRGWETEATAKTTLGAGVALMQG